MSLWYVGCVPESLTGPWTIYRSISTIDALGRGHEITEKLNTEELSVVSFPTQAISLAYLFLFSNPPVIGVLTAQNTLYKQRKITYYTRTYLHMCRNCRAMADGVWTV